jgi:hypothetical protein
MYFFGEGNPTTGSQRTMQDQVNLQSGLKSKEECIQKEEFASKNHSEVKPTQAIQLFVMEFLHGLSNVCSK